MPSDTFLIYNVTNKVAHSIHIPWLLWMKEHHIPAMLATGCFFKATILHLKEVEDEDGHTYAIQYHAASQEDYNRYLEVFSATLRQETINKWGNQFIAFRTVMHVVD